MIAVIRNRVRDVKVVNELTNMDGFRYVFSQDVNLNSNEEEKCSIVTTHAILKTPEEVPQVYLEITMKSVVTYDDELKDREECKNMVLNISKVLQPFLELEINKQLKINKLPRFKMPELKGKVIDIYNPNEK